MLPRAWKVLQIFWLSETTPILTPVKLPLITPFPVTSTIQVKFPQFIMIINDNSLT